MPKKYEVCAADDMPAGSRRIVTLAGRSIGVFNVGGDFYAVRNACPHKGAPLCKGAVTGFNSADRPGTVEVARDGEILRCPWHGWEFDLKTGESVFNPNEVCVRKYAVSVSKPNGDEGPDMDDSAPQEAIETYSVSVEAEKSGGKRIVFVEV